MRAARLPRLERDIVVHVAVASAAGGGHAARRWARAAEIAAAFVRKTAAATAAAVQHGQGRVEALQHDLGRVFLNAALVGPFAGLQLALDVHFRALLQILLGDLAEPLVEDHHAMPLGLFLAFAGGLVAPALQGVHATIADRPPVLGAPDSRILAQISAQDHLFHTPRHRRSPRSKSRAEPARCLTEGTRRSRPPTYTLNGAAFPKVQ